MPVQKCAPKQKTAPPTAPLAWWKKLLLGLFGTYLAAKLFGILVPDIRTAGFSASAKDSNEPSNFSYASLYADDTWDLHDDLGEREDRHLPYDDDFADDEEYRDDEYDLDPYEDEPIDDPLYDDEDDWNEGYDDDHFD